MRLEKFVLSTLILVMSAQLASAQKPQGKPEDTEVWKPEPKVVTPGADGSAAPSDAIVLFDGKNLDEWVNVKDGSPASCAEGSPHV